MKKNGWKNHVFGMVLMALLVALAVPAFATTGKKQMEVDYLDIKLVVDGKEVTPKDVNGKVVEPFVYNGTTYLPVRAVGEALGKTVHWDGETKTVYLGETSQLNVIGNVDGLTEAEKTYGLNRNYANRDDRLNWDDMPNFMAALEGQSWTYVNGGNAEIWVRMYSKSGVSTDLHFSYYSAEDGLEVRGYDPIESYVTQLSIIEGLLKDMVCDADREAIVELLKTEAGVLSDGYTERAGITAEATDWLMKQPTSYTFSEVKVEFGDYLTRFTIKTK